jgi:hypothetical protein
MRKDGLSPKAYVPVEEGESYEPFVSPSESPAEFTFKAVGLGIVFGIIFGAANAYLGLRAGLTISTSIPVAVMTVAVFRALAGVGIRGSILETNISQDHRFGVKLAGQWRYFHVARLVYVGYATRVAANDAARHVGRSSWHPVHDSVTSFPDRTRTRQAAVSRRYGLRRGPREGTACAEVLVANEIGGGRARFVFYGLAGGAFFKFLTSWIHVIPGAVHARIPFLRLVGCQP